jgi:hypothetical protein
MRTYIKKLQSKSEDTRKQILVGSLIVCMSLVGVVWVNSLGYKFGNKESTAKEEGTIKPFALFGESISNTYNNVTASVGKISGFKEEAKKVEVEKQIDMIPVEKE